MQQSREKQPGVFQGRSSASMMVPACHTETFHKEKQEKGGKKRKWRSGRKYMKRTRIKRKSVLSPIDREKTETSVLNQKKKKRERE
jgi:hypothetical protein